MTALVQCNAFEVLEHLLKGCFSGMSASLLLPLPNASIPPVDSLAIYRDQKLDYIIAFYMIFDIATL